MDKRHYITIAICSLIIVIASALFGYYYKEYIAPESYVIGSSKDGVYKDLAFADYYSDEDIIFSQNINKSTFSVTDNIASYEFNFEHKDFDGIKNSYMLYVNDYMVNNITSEAGTITGTYTLNYYNVDKRVLCSSDITINFSFYSLASKLQVSLQSEDLGYLMKFFKTDNFIITLANNPFVMEDKEGEVDEKINEITQLTLKVEELNGTVATLNSDVTAKQAEIDKLKAQGNADSEEILKLQTEVDSLKATIADLEYQVSYYEQLLEEFQNIKKLKISFVVDNNVYDVKFVNSGDKLEEFVAEPSKTGYKFMGWSKDGSQVIDVSTITISEDITLIALFQELHTVTYKNGSEIVATEYVETGDILPAKTTFRQNCEFYGWSLDRSNLVNSDYIVDKDIELYALFKAQKVTYEARMANWFRSFEFDVIANDYVESATFCSYASIFREEHFTITEEELIIHTSKNYAADFKNYETYFKCAYFVNDSNDSEFYKHYIFIYNFATNSATLRVMGLDNYDVTHDLTLTNLSSETVIIN